MTREEIIEGLKLLEDNIVHFDELQNDKGEWIDVHELLFEVIQTLEQEPTYYPPCQDCNKKMDEIRRIYDKIKEQESCDNAISCSDMLDAIGHGTTYTSEELQKIITNLLPVTQKSGKWIPIPDNATNGDVIKALFINSLYEEDAETSDNEDYICMHNGLNSVCDFDIKWWNAPYQKGASNEVN